jgi:hypothetical protein
MNSRKNAGTSCDSVQSLMSDGMGVNSDAPLYGTKYKHLKMRPNDNDLTQYEEPQDSVQTLMMSGMGVNSEERRTPQRRRKIEKSHSRLPPYYTNAYSLGRVSSNYTKTPTMSRSIESAIDEKPLPTSTKEKVQIVKEDHSQISADSHENCAICLDDITSEAALLSCGHKFHRSCTKAWLVQNSSCPICRAFIKTRS